MTTLGPMFELDYSILGGVNVRAGGSTAPIRMGEQVRLLLGRLLLKPGARVTTEAIADALWGEDDKASRRNGVQHAVRAARNALGDTQSPRRVIVLEGDAYRMLVENPLSIDAERFKALSARGHELVERNPRAARAMLAEALSAWRGSLLCEFTHRPWVIGHAAELDRLRDRTEVDLNEARLALGEHADLGAAGVELLRLGDLAARGTPHRPSGLAASRGYGGAHPGNTVLCVRLDAVGRVQGGPALGSACLLAAT